MARSRRRKGNLGRGAARIDNSASSTNQTARESTEEGSVCIQDCSYSIFLNKSTFLQHYQAQGANKNEYLAILLLLHSKHVQLNSVSKSMGLAAAWVWHDYRLADAMLGLPQEQFGLKEVLKAVTILDSARSKRANEKFLKRLEAQGCKKKHKIAQLKSLIATTGEDIPPVRTFN